VHIKQKIYLKTKKHKHLINKRDAGPHGDFPRFVYEDGKWTLAAENQ
jgi:hypothetical protein